MYKIITIIPNGIKEVCSIEDQKAKNLISESFKLSEFKEQLKKIEGFLNCLNEYTDTLKEFNSKDIDCGKMEVELKIKISNCLTHMKSFLDNTQTYLSRKYGKDSDELNTFSKATHNEYEKYFHYRFIYELRNYIQHCSQNPFSQIGKKIDLKTEKIIIDVTFNKEDFIKSYKNLKPKFKTELYEAQVENINITECLIMEKESLLRIQGEVLKKISNKELFEAALNVYEFKAKYPKYDMFGVVREDDLKNIGKKENTTLSIIELEVDVAEYLLKVLNQNKG